MHGWPEEERSLMGNAEVLLMKRRVITKVSEDFAALEGHFRHQLDHAPSLQLPEGTLRKAGKISQGENYRGLPYLVLDYPRLMSREQVLNIRLLFWWGHYYSIALHLAGAALDRYRPALKEALSQAHFRQAYLQYRGSPWEHDLNHPSFIPVQKLGSPEEIDKAHFVRIVNLLPLKHVEQLEEFARSSFTQYVAILQRHRN